MVQRGDGAGFPLESLSEARRRNLDRHVPPQTRIVGSVHLTHAALPDLLFNPIGPELFANPKSCRRLKWTVVFQNAIASLPCWSMGELAIARGLLFSEEQ